MKRLIALLLTFVIGTSLLSCSTQKERSYYADKNNYITATGTVVHVKYNQEQDALYLAFEDLDYPFSDPNFKIIGKNLEIVQNNGIDEILQLGDTVSFTAAPKYFGAGYVIPLVEVSVAGQTLLSFDDGFHNLQKWLTE